jgi:hypothetical protein
VASKFPGRPTESGLAEVIDGEVDGAELVSLIVVKQPGPAEPSRVRGDPGDQSLGSGDAGPRPLPSQPPGEPSRVGRQASLKVGGVGTKVADPVRIG